VTGAALEDLATRVGPVLIFLVAITVVAEIADAAGVFDVAGHWAARAGRGRTWQLWLLIVGLSCLSTIVLSLDTRAVLLTPVVIAMARQLGLNPLPFAMTRSGWPTPGPGRDPPARPARALLPRGTTGAA